MTPALHKTAYNRAKTARAGAFAQLAGGGGTIFADAPVARLRTVFRKTFGLLTADFANRPLSEVRCLLSHLKLTARKGNTRMENNNMRKQTWKAAVSAAAIAAGAAIPMAANAAYTSVTQTINNVAWRFQLDPSTGTAILGLDDSRYNDEAKRACPNVAVNAANIPWTFTGDDGVFYTVTAIARAAFYHNNGLTGLLTIPDAVTTVGNNAFSECKGLTELAGCRNVHVLDGYAFVRCTNMSGTYPDFSLLTTIGESPFQQNAKMSGPLKLGNSITALPRLAFSHSNYSGTAVIPPCVTTMGHNTNYGVFQDNSNLEAIWVKGKVTAASQDYTTVYCAKLAASCQSMKMILIGRNTKGARMTQTDGNAMLASDSGVQVFVPANGYWTGLVAGGSNNTVWYYGPSEELDLAVNDADMTATFTPTTVNALTNALSWVSDFKTHFNLDTHISVTNTLDLTGVTIDSTAVSGVTFDRLMFSAKTQAQLNAILGAFPATTPISIDPTGLTENMVIPETYNNVYVKTVPGVTIKRTTSGFVLIVK